MSRHGETFKTYTCTYIGCDYLRIDCYFRAHMEYKRPEGGLKILWSALGLIDNRCHALEAVPERRAIHKRSYFPTEMSECKYSKLRL